MNSPAAAPDTRTEPHAAPDMAALPGLAASRVRWILRACVRLTPPGCLPLVAVLAALGLAAIAAGWWAALPARLPGDEWYDLGRVFELSSRTLFALAQSPDAPPRPTLATLGVRLVMAGVGLLALGCALWALRRPVQRQLMGWARDVRLVRVDDDAGRGVLAAPSPATTVLVVSPDEVAWSARHLMVGLDAAFLAKTLPRCAAHVQELLALDRDSRINLELVRRLIECRAGGAPARLGRLRLRLDPPLLRAALGREAEFATVAADARLVSLPETRCRQLLRAQPPNKVRLLGGARRAALVIVGLGDTGLEFFPRLCAQAQSCHGERPVIVLVDTGAGSIARQITHAWPALSLSVELHAVTIEARLPDSAERLLAHLTDRGFVPTCIYLALEERSLAEAWDQQLALACRTLGEGSPLVLSVIHRRNAPADSSLLAEEEALDALPRQLHEAFLREAAAHHAAPRPASVPWARLPFEYQEANRSAADHFWAKACDLNLRIVPRSAAAQTLPAAAADLERLAAAEHRRWCADRALFGWRVGPERAEARHLNPALVPWGALAEEEREKDREVLRRMPDALAAGGLGLQPFADLALPHEPAERMSATAILSAAAHAAAQVAPWAIPHLIVAVEDAAGFLLAEQLAAHPEVAVSLVLAQPLAGFALAAGRPSGAAGALGEAAWSLRLTRPEAIAGVLHAWPTLAVEGP
jgi:hypothetical protein